MADDNQPNMIDAFSMHVGRTFPWHELYVPDVEAAIKFYSEALGFESDKMPMGEMGDYHMLKIGGMNVAGIMQTGTPQVPHAPPHWAVYLSVDDVDARVEKAVALGASVIVPAMDVPTVGRMALIMDPQQAMLWLYKPEPAPAA